MQYANSVELYGAKSSPICRLIIGVFRVKVINNNNNDNDNVQVIPNLHLQPVEVFIVGEMERDSCFIFVCFPSVI